MAMHNDTGKVGEKLAAEYLVASGFSILHTNWRYGNWEIDIIASKANVVHVFEVKTRRSAVTRLPEQIVSRQKMRFLINAGNEFMLRHKDHILIQFDILIILMKGEKAEFILVEDFYIW